MINVLYATLIVGAVGLVLGAVLSLASKFLYVEEDERIAKITELLPGANCGGCGFAGCANYADAIVTDGKPANCCPSCSQEAVDKISEILGIETIVAEKKVAYVKCNGGNNYANKKYEYYGMNNCEAAARLLDGFIECKYGCLGFGNCVSVCPVNAISIIDGVAVINEQTCIGCGNCVKTCPKSVISMIPADSKVRIRCSNHDKGAVTKKNCVSGCLGCKICEKTCEVGAVKVVDNVAVIDFSICTQCGKCVEKCPKKIIKFN
ncbi:MAG: RnfABCDGE type electron transport complex subunit B [Clostridia bacterium]|nr:RnfABCDGE type electron transport complex subunit B [Clostridia bacterium]